MFRPLHIAATGNGSVGGSGTFTTVGVVNVNTAAATAILTIYQGQTTAGPIVAVIDCTAIRSLILGADCKDGFHWVLAGGNADLTITYK